MSESIPAPAPASVAKVSLHDACRRISRTVRSPELIAAFQHLERQAGRHTDTEDEYRARFATFAKQPVTN